jgi:hypothetical protein
MAREFDTSDEEEYQRNLKAKEVPIKVDISIFGLDRVICQWLLDKMIQE